MHRSFGAVVGRALTCPVRVLPDFVVIGTHRGGTSAFYHYLTGHPAVGAATTKELNYFDKNYAKGSWWYRAHFPTEIHKRLSEAERGHRFVTGEASPSYLFHPDVPERLAATVPHAKLIALLRNPVDRAYSHYRRNIQQHWEVLPFDEALAEDARRLEAEPESYGPAMGVHFVRRAYLGRGLYAEQLRRWFRAVPREQFLILRSEDFYAEPGVVLRQALAFLDVPADELPVVRTYEHFDGSVAATSHAHARAIPHVASQMAPEVRERLNAYFAPHNQRLYELLGADLGWQ